jgi:hypothetical protein
MSLLPCRECGEQISNQAKTCPKCGKKHPVLSPFEQSFTENPGMWVALFVVALLLWIVFSSTHTDSTYSASAATNTTSPEVQTHYMSFDVGISSYEARERVKLGCYGYAYDIVLIPGDPGVLGSTNPTNLIGSAEFKCNGVALPKN